MLRAREGGTLFLDEVTEMAPEMQVRLLRVLETGRFTRSAARRRSPRACASSRRPTAIRARRSPTATCARDLPRTACGFPIALPALREREGDAELLAEHLSRQLNEAEGTSKQFSRQSIATIRAHRWPGNVRELKNAVQRAFILADDEVGTSISRASRTPPPVRQLPAHPGRHAARRDRAQGHLRHADLCEGNKRRCAGMLGVSLKTLYNRLAEYQAGNAPSLPST